MENKKNNNVLILVLSIIISFVCGTLGSYIVITKVPSVSKSIVENVSKVELTENSIALSVEKAYDGVVTVVSYKNNQKISTGSGFVYKKDDKVGYIMTNNHVVDGADKVEVVMSNNETVEATILGKETYSDIAVLSINKDKVLSVLEIGDNSKMKLGDTVFTIGAPMGLEYSGTVTKGILSGKDRMVEVSFSGSTSDYYMKVLQTDAAISPGNSGGPLLDVNGAVIGINSLKLVKDEVEGMGFAIPIEIALSYVDRLEKGETISRPYLGIQTLDAASYNSNKFYYQRNYHFNIDSSIEEGVIVASVEKGSVAEKAGLKEGDVIFQIDGTDTSDSSHFRYLLYKYKVGDIITVKFYRGKDVKELKIVLSASKKD